MTRWIIALAASSMLLVNVGCATKKHVRQQTGPLIEKVNELDELTAQNTNAIRDVDTRAQRGIQDVQQRAAAADQKAVSARQRADEAQTVASTAASRADLLQQTVVNLDNYRPVVETTVHFGFDRDNLTPKAKKALDLLAAEIANSKHWIIEVRGGADSTGDQQYNYDLSERRASNVIQYLASAHNIPAHKIYVIGLGEDDPIARNASRSGRAKNRRVDVRLMTNEVASAAQAQQSNQPQ